MRVAIVHDWLISHGGAERTLASMLRCYPGAEVFTLFDFMAPEHRGFMAGHRIHTSFLQRLPGARSGYRRYLPLMPLAVESFDLSDFDLVLSSSFCVAKGVLTGPDQTHVSYIHSPMRYAWDLQHQYLREANLERGLRGLAARGMLQWLRGWDARSANGVDHFVANSAFVARRVRKCYRRESSVVHPPVDTDYFRPGKGRDDFYVTVSRLVPYKQVELIVDAFNRMPDRQLVVIGDGPRLDAIRGVAGPNVRVLGAQSADATRDHLQRARAFVFAAIEDFGIAPVEAQACGTPVIALGWGGALETVVPGRTGVFFAEQTAQALIDAVGEFEVRAGRMDPEVIRAHALRFSEARFRAELMQQVEAAMGGQQPDTAGDVLPFRPRQELSR